MPEVNIFFLNFGSEENQHPNTMNENSKKIKEILAPKQILSVFMKANKVSDYEFNDCKSLLTCYHDDDSRTVFHIGMKQSDASEDELLADGMIVLKGYDGKNWLYLSRNCEDIEVLK